MILLSAFRGEGGASGNRFSGARSFVTRERVFLCLALFRG